MRRSEWNPGLLRPPNGCRSGGRVLPCFPASQSARRSGRSFPSLHTRANVRRSRPASLPGDARVPADGTAEGDPPTDTHRSRTDISIILPAHDEAAIIESSVRRVSGVLARLGRAWEIIVADSASEDGTGERVRRMQEPNVRVVRVDEPGKGAAIGAGLRVARGAYVGFLDSDLEIEPEDLPRFVRALDEGADAAIASKTDRAGGRPLRRRLSTAVYNGLVRILLGTPYADHQGGMKLFRGDAAALARSVECPGWFWDTEVLVALARHGCRVREIPVTAGTRRAGRLLIAPVTLELLRGLGRLSRSRSRGGEVSEPGPNTEPEAEGSGARVPPRRWALLVALACVGAIVGLFHPRLLLTDTTPAGYDLSGHVYPLWLGVRHLLRSGHIHGWSNGWFAGFPLFYFYFPLPAYVTAALTPLLGFSPAFKVMSVMGVATLPLAVYWLLCELRLGQVATATATVAASGFVLTRYVDLGGNIPSTLGGEFAYALSLTSSLAYLAALLRATRRPGEVGPMGLAAVLLAATALSHTITTLAVVVGVAPLLLERRSRMPVLVSWTLGFLLTAFWSVPFLARSSFLWSPFPGTTPMGPRALPLSVAVVAPAALGGLWALRGSRPARLLAWFGIVSLLAAAVPQRAFFALRFLPYWYLVLFIFAGLAAGLVLEAALRRRSMALTAAGVLLALVPLHGALRYGYLHAWAGREYGGFERETAWPILDGLAGALRGLPPGRLYWEDDAGLFSSLGSRHVLTLLPYWAPGHDALGGLWVESSPTAGTVAELDRRIASAGNAETGASLWPGIVTELGSLGVRYFITVHDGSAAALRTVPGVRAVGTTGPFTLFEIPAEPLVQAPAGAAPATGVHISEGEIRFRADSLGVPYRIMVSYFPNWKAEGATKPRPTGTFMSVVPTRPDVRLRFGTTWAEVLGTSLTVLSVLILVGMAVRAGGPRSG